MVAPVLPISVHSESLGQAADAADTDMEAKQTKAANKGKKDGSDDDNKV